MCLQASSGLNGLTLLVVERWPCPMVFRKHSQSYVYKKKKKIKKKEEYEFFSLTHFLVMTWTAFLSLLKVQTSDRLWSMLTTVSTEWNTSNSSLYLYGRFRVGGTGDANDWYRWKAGARGLAASLLTRYIR